MRMAQSFAGEPSGSNTECNIGKPATGDEAREYWVLALEAVLDTTGSQGIFGNRPVTTRKVGVER